MKNFLKILGIILGSIFILLYLCFLIIPPFINLDNYKNEIQKLVLDNSKLKLDYSKLKIYSTPMLSIGVIFEDLKIKIDDNSTLFSSPKIKAGVALPSLLTLTFKTSNCYIENPFINLEIVDNKQYKIIQLVEEIINENNKKPAPEPAPSPIPDEIIKKIRIKVPLIKISNYNVKISDLKTNDNLTLAGEELVLGYESKNNSIKFQTNAKLFLNNKKNIEANLKLLAFLPEFKPAQEEAIDPEETIKLPFINIVDIYKTYDLHADINSKLVLKPSKKEGFTIKGFFDVDNLNLLLSDIRLPDSYFHAKFQGKKITFDSDIYAKSDEKINFQGFLNHGKHPKLKTQILSDKISFSNLLDLSKALLDSLNIKNDLAQIKTKGYLSANTTIDTDFKKLKSQGSILIKDGYFINPITSIGIKDINADFIFDNNALNIKNARAQINNSKLNLEGFIDSNTNTDIKASVDKLSLSALYNAFAPKELKKEFLLNQADLSALINIKGNFENLNSDIKTELSNFSLSDAKKSMFILNKETLISLNLNPKEFKGKIENKNFTFSLPMIKTNIKTDKINIDIDNEKIAINPFDLNYNNLSKINIKGKIENYLKNPELDIFASGNIETKNLKQTLGKEISYYIPSHGAIPLKASIKGNSKTQEILAQIYCDKNNFITPVNFKELLNNPSLIQADIKIKGNKIKIKDTGLYKKQNAGFLDDLNQNSKNATQLVDLTSAIEGNHLNLFRLKILKDLNSSIAIFKKSNFTIQKGKIIIKGDFDDLDFNGNVNISNLNIPEILFKLNKLDLNLNSKKLSLKANNIDLNGSKINIGLETDIIPTKIIKISNLIVNSDFIDVDKTMQTANKAMEFIPPTQASKPAQNQAAADIPLFAKGKFNIKKIKSGEIIVNNSKGDILIKNNNLFIIKLNAQAFSGNVSGDISMNLISGLLGIKLQGENLDADETFAKGAGLKDTISGTMNFKTNLSLKGATYLEQVKSLKGTLDFELKEGQYGPFSKLENFFLAENIRENLLFKNTIGIILTPIATIDSSHYENLSGKISFNNGIAHLNSITSRGNILCVLIKGDMNLITNELNSKVRVRLASTVSDLLGPLSLANPVNLVKNTPGLNIGTAKLFSIFSEAVEEKEYKEIPMFSKNHSDENATKFQITLKGDVNKPLKLVKSFKWLALQEDIDKAREFSNAYIKNEQQKARAALLEKLQKDYEEDNKLKVGVKKVLQMDTTAPKVKEALVDEIITKKQEAQENLQNKIQNVRNESAKFQQEKLEELRNKIIIPKR